MLNIDAIRGPGLSSVPGTIAVCQENLSLHSGAIPVYAAVIVRGSVPRECSRQSLQSKSTQIGELNPVKHHIKPPHSSLAAISKDLGSDFSH